MIEEVGVLGNPNIDLNAPMAGGDGEERAVAERGWCARRVPWRFWDLIVIIIITGFSSLVGGVGMALPMMGIGGRFIAPLAMIGSYIAIFAAVWIMAVGIRGASPVQLGFRGFKLLPALLKIAPLLAGVLLVSAGYSLLLQSRGINPERGQTDAIVQVFGGGSTGLIVAVLITALLVPVVEELFFRGFAYPIFRQSVGVGWGIFLSGMFFAIVHLDPYIFLPIAVIGFVQAWLYEKTDSLGPPIILHGLNNFLAIAGIYAASGRIF